MHSQYQDQAEARETVDGLNCKRAKLRRHVRAICFSILQSQF